MSEIKPVLLIAVVLGILWLWGTGSQQAALHHPAVHTTAPAVHRG